MCDLTPRSRDYIFKVLKSDSTMVLAEFRNGFSVFLKSRWGGGFFHSKGTWGCAAHESILFRTFGNFSRVKSRQGYAFWEFWSKRC